VIGISHDDRDILLLKVGVGDKNVILTAGVHGRESINPIVLMKMMEYYCEENFNHLKDYTFYVVPLLNPDGYMIAQRGFNVIRNEELRLAAKEKDISYREWKFNARGIDINRNFPSFSWRPKHANDFPGSENETKALMQLMDSIPSIGYIDYHSRGEEIYYYRDRMSKAYNQRQKEIADRLADDTGYTLVPPEEEISASDTGGNTVHYYSEQTKQPAFTIETVPDEATFPLSIVYQAQTFHEVLYTPLIMLF
jgi:g-D-glutamyl-meso-diaminopimelate peptidase